MKSAGWTLLGVVIGIQFGAFMADDSMRHSWIVEHYDCRDSGERREVLGETEAKWTCEKQDDFWRPIGD